MRSNSGSGKANNNLHDPTLKEHAQAGGKSGTATTTKAGEGKRKGTAGA